MVLPQPSKLMTRVRFPPPAPEFAVKNVVGIEFGIAFGNRAHIAQVVEHFLGKEEVTSSNLVMSTIV
jgi:hypothetical protein